MTFGPIRGQSFQVIVIVTVFIRLSQISKLLRIETAFLLLQLLLLGEIRIFTIDLGHAFLDARCVKFVCTVRLRVT